MSSWKRWLVYSSGASASFWGFRGWCSASLDAAVRAGIITILAQVTIINVIHQCQTDYHKFTMTKLTKKSRYFNINQKFDIDRNRQTFGFLSQSISCRAAPPLQERKSRLSTKQLRCLASLFCTPSLPPTQHFEMSHKWKDSILAKHLLHNGITQELCVPATDGLNEPDWRPDKNKTVWSTQRQKTNFENLPIGPCLAWMIYQTPHTIRWSSSLDWPFVRETCGRDSIPGDPPLCQIASSARAFFFRTPQIAHKYNIKPLIDQNKEDCTLVNE